MGGKKIASKSTILRDVLFFVKDDLENNVTDPISAARSNTSKFVMTSFPQRKVEYPLITIKATNIQALRSGMQTTAQDITITLEIRIWAKNQKDKDTIYTDVLNRLANIQFTASGSIDNDFHDHNVLSSVEVDEEGDGGVKSRILQLQYSFYNVT